MCFRCWPNSLLIRKKNTASQEEGDRREAWLLVNAEMGLTHGGLSNPLSLSLRLSLSFSCMGAQLQDTSLFFSDKNKMIQAQLEGKKCLCTLLCACWMLDNGEMPIASDWLGVFSNNSVSLFGGSSIFICPAISRMVYFGPEHPQSSLLTLSGFFHPAT